MAVVGLEVYVAILELFRCDEFVQIPLSVEKRNKTNISTNILIVFYDMW